MQKIGIAMSGGVDSSVSASLLRQQGYEVYGFFMKLPLPGAQEHLLRVQDVAGQLEIPLSIVDMQEPFTKDVIHIFIETYRKGSTPNPCIICNQQIKFGALAIHMRNHGMDKMATGHYARIGFNREGTPAVRRGCDSSKDQSYFLCRLDPKQLQNVVLPLGEMTKKEVYQLAAEMQLDRVHGPESQDVCFLAGESIASFFNKQGIAEAPGEIVNAAGQVLGKHKGLWHYTIGQRRGLGLPDATPWYVKALDEAHNHVIVCKNQDLVTTNALMHDVRWWTGEVPAAWQGLIQVRGRHTPSPAVVEQAGDTLWRITFNEPQRAITPGQFAAFYDDDLICGSGVIAPTFKG